MISSRALTTREDDKGIYLNGNPFHTQPWYLNLAQKFCSSLPPSACEDSRKNKPNKLIACFYFRWSSSIDKSKRISINQRECLIAEISNNEIFLSTNQDLVYHQMKNFYHLSMPNRQYECDKNLEEKLMNQLVLKAMNDHYTKKQTNRSRILRDV
jgi:hypothetical protein